MKTQYWLVTLDKYGNPELRDGGHYDLEGANKAMYLYQSLGFVKDGERYAVAEINIIDVKPSDKGVNKEALINLNKARLGIL